MGRAAERGRSPDSLVARGGNLLISDQMLYPSRASLEAACPFPEIRTSGSTTGDG